MKFYALLGFLFLAIFLHQERKNKERCMVIDNGITEKVLIIDKTEDCISSTRNRNRATVKTKNNIQFKIPISYSDCIDFQKGDSLLVRYLDETSEVLRVFNYTKPTKQVTWFTYILLVISLAFFIAAFSKIKSA